MQELTERSVSGSAFECTQWVHPEAHGSGTQNAAKRQRGNAVANHRLAF